MSHPTKQIRKAIPARLGFLAIYNPSLGTTDDTLDNQIVYYSSPETGSHNASQTSRKDAEGAAAVREWQNEQLRQIGLAQGMVEFGRTFSAGRSVDNIETEKSRIILHELESGWWILASIKLTILPETTKTPASKGASTEEHETIEYSPREVKPAILLLGDLLRAHSTFLLLHASSLSALFVRTRRSKFVGILGRYWDAFLSTWNVLMHGNPAASLYGGIKIAACGELGVGVGEEERGSGEREVLEGFVGRVDGLVDVIASKFGDLESNRAADGKTKRKTKSAHPWLGSGADPAAEDGIIFLGTGALSRKSLRDVSHWIEDIYRWGSYAYGIVDNPSSTRRPKKPKTRPQPSSKELSLDTKRKARQVYGLSFRNNHSREHSPLWERSRSTTSPSPLGSPAHDPALPDDRSSTGSETSKNRFVHYLRMGYGTHWTLGAGSSTKDPNPMEHHEIESNHLAPSGTALEGDATTENDGISDNLMYPEDDSVGHYLIGLMGDIEDDDTSGVDHEATVKYSPTMESDNARTLVRTLTVELVRAEDARPEADISIDLTSADSERGSSKYGGSEHTGASATSYESQDRNKTKKLRVVVYVNKPFIFVLLFELRTDALAFSSLYRSLHYQIEPLLKPLLKSTAFRASKPELTSIITEDTSTPIYDLVWDPRFLTVNSTVPNIPDPLQADKNSDSLPWSRIEALNTHMQMLNTYISTTTDDSELERTCKTSRGWWVVWTRIPDTKCSTPSSASGVVKIPHLIAEDSMNTVRSALVSRTGDSRTSAAASSRLPSQSFNSGPAHPYLESAAKEDTFPKDKEIFLVRRASDYVATKTSSRFTAASIDSGAGWVSGPGRLAQGIGVDTKRYIEGLLSLSQ